MVSRGSILIAGEDHQALSRMTSALRNRGYEVTECCESVELLEQLINFACPMKSFAFNLIISETGLPSDTCIEFMEVLGKHEGFPPIILIMNHDEENTCPTTQRIQSVAVFQKPLDLNALLTTVNKVIWENLDRYH
jgi:DNA-binding response OmpR family regulator